LANVVRKADRDFGLGEEVSHWLCVDAMSINARVLAGAMPRRTLVSGYADLKADTARMRPNVVIFDPGEFLAEHESRLPGRPLPHDWTVTSDSIAARVAEILAADELMLLKSSDPPAATLNDLAAAGYVD